MKRYIKYCMKSTALLLIVGSMFSSCNVLDQEYYMGGTPEETFSSPENIRAAAIGLYDALQSPWYLGGRMQIYVDLRGLDVNPSSYFGAMCTFDLTSSNLYASDPWAGGYRTIYETNLFLENITNVPEDIMPRSESLVYEAEAKFIRALCYFYLVNLYGQQYTTASANLGVPWVDHTFNGTTAFEDEAKIARATVDVIYSHIIDDLNFAEANLEATWDDVFSDRARATKIAAAAILSRVYLYMGNNVEAVNAANRVTSTADSRTVSLVSDLQTSCFASNDARGSSDEIILWVAMNFEDNSNTNHAIGQHYGYNRRADITVSKLLIDLYTDATDKRKDLLITRPSGNTYCNKYINVSADWAPIIRYAEVVLNKAEALAKQASAGVDPSALSLINDIRTRSDASAKVAGDFADKQAFIDFILEERRRELAFEGHGSFDLFRNQKGIPAGRGAATTPAMSYPNDRFAMPIPNAEMLKNNKLIQNLGY